MSSIPNSVLTPHPGPRALDPDAQPYRGTDEQRTRLVASIETFRDLLDVNFKFPSRHTLTRHVTSFFEGFYSHMPFIHVPTWRISEHSPELVLAILAIGS
jgi:transcription factor-like protein